MDKQFFTSKDAAKIAGCTLRQLEYWRKRKIIVPTIDTEGSGYNVYYSLGELWQLTLMGYLLEIGLDFKVCCQLLKQLKQEQPELVKEPFNFSPLRYTISSVTKKKEFTLNNYSSTQIAEAVSQGENVLMLWTDKINLRLKEGLDRVLSVKKKPLVNSR